jgi:V8-like Glu-specific endopeptidase
MTTNRPQPLSILVLAGTATLAAACGGEAAPEGRDSIATVTEAEPAVVMSRADFEARERADVASLAKIDNGDTWSYALPTGFDPSIALTGKLVTWRYAGQARFAHDPQPPTSTRYHVVQRDVPTDHDREVATMRRVDALGRIWKIESVDRSSWEALNQPHPAEREGDEPSAMTRELEPDLEPSTIVPWKPMSWSHLNCDGITGKDTHLWDGESRGAITSNFTDRQQTAVQVITNGGRCSGVILKQDEILTAAHCVSDDNNNYVPNNTVSVCRIDDPTDCRGATDIDFTGTYGGGSSTGGGTDFADDWAIIELSGSWNTTVEDMDMSSASDATIGNLTNVHNLGFPGFAPSCTNQGGTTLFHNQEWEPVAAIKNKKLKLKIDGAPGQSGSPIYYCPEGDNNVCGGGEPGFVIMVFAGWNSVDKRFVGPKVPNFKSEALLYVND